MKIQEAFITIAAAFFVVAFCYLLIWLIPKHANAEGQLLPRWSDQGE